MMMKSADREYAARVIEGIISDKQSKGCANSCIECSKDSKGCARDPGGFEWKYKGILEKVIEFLREPEPVNDKKELKEAKRLLKAAIVIIKDVDCNEDYLCDECEYRAKCDGGFSFYWRYANEAENLLSDEK